VLSEGMRTELVYAGAMVLYGCVVFAAYHVLLLFRAIVLHSRAVTDAEDILFLIAAGFGFFFTAFEKNDGILRWYAFVGFLIGGYIYCRIFAFLPEAVRKWLLQKRQKAIKIKAAKAESGSGQNKKRNRVSWRESSSPEHEEKRKAEKRD